MDFINVSKSTASEEIFGTSEPEGESFYDVAANEIGMRSDYNYMAQDIGKIINKTKTYLTDIKYQQALVKNEISELEKQKIQLQKTHDSFKPEIESKIKESVSTATYDEDFAKKLNKSSQDLYDVNYKIASASAREAHYEKSILKTDADINIAQKEKRKIEAAIINNPTIRPRSAPSYGTPKPYGLMMSQKYPDRRTDVIQKTRGTNFKRIKSLGGIVR